MPTGTLIPAVEQVSAAELQGLVDVAKLLLAFEGARKAGLMTGGPKVAVEKCRELLASSKVIGITPRHDAVGPAELLDLIHQAETPLEDLEGRQGDGSLRAITVLYRSLPGRLKLQTSRDRWIRYPIRRADSAGEIGSIMCDEEGLVIQTGNTRWELKPLQLWEAVLHAATK